MLTISAEQMAVLSTAALDQFVERQCERLRERFTARCSKLGDDDLRDLVRRGVDAAELYEIDDEAEVACFLEHFLHWPGEIESRSNGHWATVILDDPDLTGIQKLERMDDHVLFDLGGWPQ
jgi:hypothetical protein